MILNLKEFNSSVEYHKFKMETFESAIKLVTQDCFMASIDIKDAYYCVPIHEQYKKYLKFTWGEKLYQFACLPNGLACAPRKYTKMMKPVYATLRSNGHNITGYIDDNLLLASTPGELDHTIQSTINLLERLGFTLNYEKSMLMPCQQIRYLGFTIDSNHMKITLAEEKASVIVDECKKLHAAKTAKIRDVAKVIGIIVASFPGVEFGPLHYRTLEGEKTRALQIHMGNYDAIMQISDEMKLELTWWIHNIHHQNRLIVRDNAKLIISTDASSQGWGATCDGDTTGGRWNQDEQKHHINYQELFAIYLALQSFSDRLSMNRHVQILSDNTTAIAYINHMGGKQYEMNQLAKEIWAWCIRKDTWISAAHIPGEENIQAEYASRHFNDRTEWTLNDRIFKEIMKEFGQVQIDLFASRLNAKCPRYASWQRDPQAEFVDAFSRSWHDIYSYVFPPFSLMARCLQKLIRDKAEAVVVFPLWKQSWFPTVLGLLTQAPIILPQMDKLLTLPGEEKLHPLRKKLQLVAAKLSGEPSKNRTFLESLSKSCLPHGSQEHTNNIVHMSHGGTVFVYKGKWIRFNHLSLRS